ncbi:zinc dependent phospholipase C family protein [Clostridium formicaceticum]|uniref:Phospholipase C/D domain-containing protein n=1 Tax=Clostridium formicaceticum TaxID=1497 RepID=A0AAC9RJX4_9CLOT|nr:zinc dependent phospholipase C family protein [Clostridium formicaceticum]AOY76449.1 hypothetical protein BJL90_11335 [Clostridium formicaceticum]ARE86845.1 hypothetical protein CLFO_11760 [Clostridium formicaceticum]
MLPQSHVIIAKHLHKSIKEKFNVSLDRGSLIYGSVKPDIPFHLKGLRHFKPQSFDYICREIQQLSQYTLHHNKQHIKLLSTEIGIVTHFISDYFCVPHNDRKTYKNHFLEHLAYENNLHQQYKTYSKKIEVSNSFFNIDNTTTDSIQSLIDRLHEIYTLKKESYLNDLESSLQASTAVAFYIIYHNKINGKNTRAA